jgi:dipeptide/tripeptide permease
VFPLFGSTGWVIIAGIAVFSFGEMAASPKSQEYIGRIAPEDKVALFMGYYFVTIALGNLFGGLLSGFAYGTLARDMQRPDLMWLLFMGLGLLTALCLYAYDRLVVGRPSTEPDEKKTLESDS